MSRRVAALAAKIDRQIWLGEDSEQMDRMWAEIPLHMKDQAWAAVNDIMQTRDAFIQRGFEAGGSDFRPDDPQWYRQAITTAMACYLLGEGRVCSHTVSPVVQPLVTAAWSPDIIVCGLCTPALRPTTPVVENTCDACGRYSPKGVFPGSLTVGIVTLLFGVCRRCYDEMRARETR